MSYSRTYAIADDNDTIITDMELLGLLYDFRYINTLPCEITNKSLAYFATYPPTTKESFVKSYGVGEAVYIKCGEKILDFIINYLDKKSHNK